MRNMLRIDSSHHSTTKLDQYLLREDEWEIVRKLNLRHEKI